jgi:hypothetical protein
MAALIKDAGLEGIENVLFCLKGPDRTKKSGRHKQNGKSIDEKGGSTRAKKHRSS